MRTLALAGLWLAAGQVGAVNVALCTGTTQTLTPDGPVPMWGYGLEDGSGACAISVPGPELRVPPGDSTLSITLRNRLPEASSIVISGQAMPTGSAPVMFTDAEGRPRVRSFTLEAAPNGGLQTYTWSNLKPGTYLYSSGTHPAVQVQMGLYGSVIQDVAAGEAYPGVGYDEERVVLLSEIDPGLHAAVASGIYGTGAYTSTIDYTPKHFLVNGDAFGGATLPAGAALTETTLLRFLNAGLGSRAMLLQGDHLSLVTEDGNLYPYPRERYSVLMAAGKTRDALFTPPGDGRYALYDRRLRDGQQSGLEVGATLLAVDDAFTVLEDTASATFEVLLNDIGVDTSTVTILRPPEFGGASVDASGAIVYTFGADFNGMDSLTYTFEDSGSNLSNVATVRIVVASVNDLPLAVADSFAVEESSSGTTLDVMANDSDADGDPLRFEAGGLGIRTPNGRALIVGTALSYAPNRGFAGTDTFDYTITDGVATATATVTVTVGGAAVEEEPYVLWTDPTITSPPDGSTLEGDSVTFTWAANAASVDEWWLYVGSSPKSRSHHDSRNLFGATTATVTGLPLDGSTVHVTLWYRASGASWKTVEQTYTAATVQ